MCRLCPLSSNAMVVLDNELLKIENEQTRGVRFQSVMTVTDEDSHYSKNAGACPNLTGLYRSPVSTKNQRNRHLKFEI